MKTRLRMLLVMLLASMLYGCEGPGMTDPPLYGSQAVAIISRPGGGGDYSRADLDRLKFDGAPWVKKELHLTEKRIMTEQAVLVEVDPAAAGGDEFHVLLAAASAASATGYVKKTVPEFVNEAGTAFAFGIDAMISDDKWVTAGGSGYATIIHIDTDKRAVVNMCTSGTPMTVRCQKVPSSITLDPCEFTIVTGSGTNCNYTTPEPISGLSGTGEEGDVRALLVELREMSLAADGSLTVCSP